MAGIPLFCAMHMPEKSLFVVVPAVKDLLNEEVTAQVNSPNVHGPPDVDAISSWSSISSGAIGGMIAGAMVLLVVLLGGAG